MLHFFLILEQGGEGWLQAAVDAHININITVCFCIALYCFWSCWWEICCILLITKFLNCCCVFFLASLPLESSVLRDFISRACVCFVITRIFVPLKNVFEIVWLSKFAGFWYPNKRCVSRRDDKCWELSVCAKDGIAAGRKSCWRCAASALQWQRRLRRWQEIQQ